MVGEEEVKIGRGVIQGGVLSPTLFIIMFNDLMVNLKQNQLDAFAYADDLAVVGYDKGRLLKAIDIIE